MPDALGYRAKMAVLVPSTNTIMEPELYAMAPRSATFHAGRMYVPEVALTSIEEAQTFIGHVRGATESAIREVLTLKPDRLLHGMSALSFMDGMAGHRRFKAELEHDSGLPVTTAAEAVLAALEAFQLRRIGPAPRQRCSTRSIAGSLQTLAMRW